MGWKEKGYAAPVARGHAPVPVKPPKAAGVQAGKWELRDYQREAVDFFKAHAFRALLADGPGVGKSAPALVTVVENDLFPALVVAPASVVLNWRREAKRWAKGRTVEVVKDDVPQVDVTIASWNVIWARMDELQARGFKAIIIDECHYAVNPTAQRSQAAYGLCRVIPNVLLLSGTPMVNDAEELDTLGRLLGLAKGTPPPMLRRLLEDVAKDVPPKRRVYVPIALDVRAQALYDAVQQDFEEYLRKELGAKLADIVPDPETGVASALSAEALVKVGYLRRVLARGKVQAAIHWVVQANRAAEPVVVFAEHQDVLDGVKKGLRRARVNFMVIEGSTPKKERQKAIDTFQTGQVPVLLCSKAAKEGVTLTRARHTLFVERFWTAADEEQAEDRTHRLGQRYETTMWYLHATGTFDDRIREIVEAKRAKTAATIGGARVEEVPLDNIATVMRRGDPTEEQVAVADGGDLPRLPKPKTVHAILFDPRAWAIPDAARWCRMQGYKPSAADHDPQGRVRVTITPWARFTKGTFRITRAARDIVLVTAEPRKRRRRAKPPGWAADALTGT